MANKTAKGNGLAGGVMGALGIIGTVITIVTPLIDYVKEEREKRAEERKDWVTIPELCSKRNPIKLDYAVTILKTLNLKFACFPINIKKSNAKYRDCFDMQVVSFEPKHKKLINPQTESVQLYYVTSEIIQESQRLFEESEKRKAEIKNEKCKKMAEQKQKVQRRLNHTVKFIMKKNPDIDVVDEDIYNIKKENTYE